MSHSHLFGLILFSSIIGFICSEYCFNEEGPLFCHMTECCGNSPHQYCCDKSQSWIIGVAVGSVFASILLVTVIVAMVCICLKKHYRDDRVVYPLETTAYTVTYTGHDPYLRFKMSQQQSSSPYSSAYPPSVTPMSQQSQYQSSRLPESLKSKQPSYGGLPDNHRVV